MEYHLLSHPKRGFNPPKNISFQSSYWERKAFVRAQLKTTVKDLS